MGIKNYCEFASQETEVILMTDSKDKTTSEHLSEKDLSSTSDPPITHNTNITSESNQDISKDSSPFDAMDLSKTSPFYPNQLSLTEVASSLQDDQDEAESLNTLSEELPSTAARSHSRKTKRHSEKFLHIFQFNLAYRTLKIVFLSLLILFLFLGSLGAGMGIGYFAFLVAKSPIPTEQNLSEALETTDERSQLLYANGETITEIQTELIRTTVASEDISPLIKEALIATEDEYFLQHQGIVPKAIVRAVLSEAIGYGGGSGGSTITQQLVKQQLLTSETNYKRKANEILLAMRLEKFFSKDDILTAYLNVSPFGRNNKGQNIAGIETAAQGIFGVSAKDVSLPQAAYLAGLPQSPIIYNPYTNTGEKKEAIPAGIERKNHVLFNMYRTGAISKEEYEQAKAYDITQDFIEPETVDSVYYDYLYYYLQDEVLQILVKQHYEQDGISEEAFKNSKELQEKYYELAERDLKHKGYTIETTIDEQIYNALQAATTDYGYILDDGRDMMIQVGSILQENTTGKILGFIGGRDYDYNQNNHAFYTRRSPASTIKPIIAYAPAIDIGLVGTQTQLSNFPTTFTTLENRGDPVTNYGGTTGDSFVSVQEALKDSLNIPVFHLYKALLQEKNPEEYFQKMNIKLSPEEFLRESIPLGGTDYGVTVAEQTAAYATLANEGIYHEPYVIETIKDPHGNIVYEHKDEPVSVFSPETASIMNYLMRDVLDTGTGQTAKDTLLSLSYRLGNADWVGKTGTSQDNRDYWFIASTPSITLSSWIGYDDNTPMYDAWGKNNMKFWAYTAYSAYMTQPELFNVEEEFELLDTVIQSDVSNFTGEKMGTLVIDNKSIKVPGTRVLSYYAVDGAPASHYRFGIGGTDEDYEEVWQPYVSGSFLNQHPNQWFQRNNRRNSSNSRSSDSTTTSSSDALFDEEE